MLVLEIGEKNTLDKDSFFCLWMSTVDVFIVKTYGWWVVFGKKFVSVDYFELVNRMNEIQRPRWEEMIGFLPNEIYD